MPRASSKLNVYDSAVVSLKKICKNIPVVQKMRHDRMVSFLRLSDHIFVSIVENRLYYSVWNNRGMSNTTKDGWMAM